MHFKIQLSINYLENKHFTSIFVVLVFKYFCFQKELCLREVDMWWFLNSKHLFFLCISYAVWVLEPYRLEFLKQDLDLFPCHTCMRIRGLKSLCQRYLLYQRLVKYFQALYLCEWLIRYEDSSDQALFALLCSELYVLKNG